MTTASNDLLQAIRNQLLPSYDDLRVIRINAEFLGLIAAGKKKIEVRLEYPSSPIYGVKPFERALFVSGPTLMQMVNILAVRRYKSIEEALKIEKANDLIPGSTSEEIGATFNGLYSEEMRATFPIVVVEVVPDHDWEFWPLLSNRAPKKIDHNESKEAKP